MTTIFICNVTLLLNYRYQVLIEWYIGYKILANAVTSFAWLLFPNQTGTVFFRIYNSLYVFKENKKAYM